MNELYNPYDDELYDDDEEVGLELVEVAEKPRKRRKRKNPEPAITVATPLLLLIAGYLGWCVYAQSKTKVWTWTPWKLAIQPAKRLLRRANPNNTEAERAYDRAVEKMMAPAVSVVERDIWKVPTYRPIFEETPGFIEP